MKWRVFYLLSLGIILAGLVHISIVLLIPKLGTRDAWAFLSNRTDLFAFTRLKPEESGSAITEVDPFFTYGVCRFELSEAPLKMEGPLTTTFWSASVFDENGSVIYSLNNRTAIDNKLDLLIVNPLQTLELQEAQPEDVESSVVIEAGIERGFVIIRVLEPDNSWVTDSDAFFSEIKCARYDYS
jgi:uncharacterized membrane protein